jgi:hypothetical protein
MITVLIMIGIFWVVKLAQKLHVKFMVAAPYKNDQNDANK